MKLKYVNKTTKLFAKYEQKVDAMKKLSKHKEIMAALKEVQSLEVLLMQNERPLCFAEFDLEVQERYLRAADYAAVFVDIKTSNDETIGSVVAYYVCRCTYGGKAPCNTIILSKLWARMFEEEPLRKGQC